MSVKTYDCTDGGAQHCQGCYTMTESVDHLGAPDGYGDWVSKDDYEELNKSASWQPISTFPMHEFDKDRWYMSGPMVLVAWAWMTDIKRYHRWPLMARCSYTEDGKVRWIGIDSNIVQPKYWMPCTMKAPAMVPG